MTWGLRAWPAPGRAPGRVGVQGEQDSPWPRRRHPHLPVGETHRASPRSNGSREISVTCPGFHHQASRTMGGADRMTDSNVVAIWSAGSRGRRTRMRTLTALALGTLVVLTGCATRRLGDEVRTTRYAMPPSRVISRRPVPAPSSSAVRAPAAQRAADTVSADLPEPPTPPSMALLRASRPTAATRSDTGAHQPVPINRSGLVQPAIAAPVQRTRAAPAMAPTPAPCAVTPAPCAAPPRVRAPSPCTDVRTLFRKNGCPPVNSNCSGGT